MNKKQLSQALRALETFEHAALSYGWHADHNGQTTEFKAKRLYKAAKTRLTNILKDIAADDATPVTQPLVPGVDSLLTAEEREALRGEASDIPEQPDPPAAAAKKLRSMGYSVAEWHHFDGWWVGYAHHDNPAICTISEVSGKAFIEVCKPCDHATVELPFPKLN